MVVQQNSDFVLKVKAEGSILPENILVFIGMKVILWRTMARVFFNTKSILLQKLLFFILRLILLFQLDYELNVVSVPTISSFEMKLTFPNYFKRKQEINQGYGNAVIPKEL